MSTIEHAGDLPDWAALAVSFFLVIGAGLTLIGTIGFVRLPTFYERIHAPTLGTSWGTGGIVMASMIFFTVLSTRPVVHEILIGIFVTVTTPVTLMLLARATLHRDRAEGNPGVPAEEPVEAGNREGAATRAD
ncbi:monovalent cation/H(+) antiporter subunit G [Shinella curvata]|uniref:Monovalent cation/H(+) antiporter subunit G n=1 Tax=Shinella curvata TaxID=1817964 RepID=A0ABT8XAR4_9HYPH|nr:monovalent cation/H(+) antiporter subunit G [Shinella curvata]MCJ8055076.1 monovalent cation/H(+) antiporter subunit G [Shinella curvata]MDO6120528.1 monovalent cation/H(+) antiporter subunit G [Shinella curvata]